MKDQIVFSDVPLEQGACKERCWAELDRVDEFFPELKPVFDARVEFLDDSSFPWSADGTQYKGCFEPAGNPTRIALNLFYLPEIEDIFRHELGHWIDCVGVVDTHRFHKLTRRRDVHYRSETDPLFEAWRRAVQPKRLYLQEQIKALTDDVKRRLAGLPKIDRVVLKWGPRWLNGFVEAQALAMVQAHRRQVLALEDHQRYAEIWARFFAQISARDGEKFLKLMEDQELRGLYWTPSELLEIQSRLPDEYAVKSFE